MIEKSLFEVSRSNIELYVQANTRIKNHIGRKGVQIKVLAKDEEMKPYARCALKYLSSILECLSLIEENIKGINMVRVQT